MVTRAIHLELVRDLSLDAFISVLFRFIARRGQCVKFYSDNGTNFIGAKKILSSWAFDLSKESKFNDRLSELALNGNLFLRQPYILADCGSLRLNRQNNILLNVVTVLF